MSFGEDLSELVAANAAGVLSAAPHWSRSALGTVATVINGFAFPSKHFKASKGHPLVRIRDVVKGSSETLYNGPIPEGYWVNDGDLLVGMDGDFNCALWQGGKALLNQRVCKIVPDETRLRKRFLLYVLPGYLKLINDYTSSVTVKHLSSRTLQQVPLPLPEPEEQDELLARVDMMFAEIDEGEAALAEARAGVETYRNSLLKAAVTGELTADWRQANPPKETGEQLLARILADRRAQWHADPKNAGKKYVEPAGPDTDGLPELPESWTWSSLQQLSLGLRNGLSTKPTADHDGIPILRISAVRAMEIVDRQVRYLPRSTPVEGSLVEKDDLLATRYSGSPQFVGVVAKFRGAEPIAYPDKLIRITVAPVGSELADYLEIAMNIWRSRSFVKAHIKTTAGQHGIAGSSLALTPIPLPSLAEISEILRSIANRLNTRAERDQMALAEQAASALRQSILAAAFRGELA